MILVNRETFQKRIDYNLAQVKTITEDRYPSLYAYFHDARGRRSTLYSTYRHINAFLRKKIEHPIRVQGRYVFFLDTDTLTRSVRKRDRQSRPTSNRHINLLSAIGYFPKCADAPDILQNYKRQHGLRRTINAYYMPDLTDEYLQEMDSIAKSLRASGITAGNISYNQLMHNEQTERGNSTYLYNNRNAPRRKAVEIEQLCALIDFAIEDKGYCSKSDIAVNLPDISRTEIDKLYRIFRRHLQERYTYKCPTKAQIELYGLPDRKYIFTARGEK